LQKAKDKKNFNQNFQKINSFKLRLEAEKTTYGAFDAQSKICQIKKL
jgi:hypothetical protein